MVDHTLVNPGEHRGNYDAKAETADQLSTIGSADCQPIAKVNLPETLGLLA